MLNIWLGFDAFSRLTLALAPTLPSASRQTTHFRPLPVGNHAAEEHLDQNLHKRLWLNPAIGNQRIELRITHPSNRRVNQDLGWDILGDISLFLGGIDQGGQGFD